MFEQSFDAKDVAVILAATDLLSEETVVTLWFHHNRLMICVPARNATRTFVLSVGSQVTVLTSEQPVGKAYEPATLKLSALQRVLDQKGSTLRVSLDPEEGCLAVAGMNSGSGGTVYPAHIRSTPITRLELPA